MSAYEGSQTTLFVSSSICCPKIQQFRYQDDSRTQSANQKEFIYRKYAISGSENTILGIRTHHDPSIVTEHTRQ